MSLTRTPSPAVAAQFAARTRRRRSAVAAAVVAVVLVASGVFGYQQYNRKPTEPVHFPAGLAGADRTGVARGSGAVTIDVYADFMCPDCKRFEQAGAQLLDDLVRDDRAVVVVHPVAFLDRVSNGTEYSTRATAAAGCAADQGRFTQYQAALFRAQPAENTAGLPDSRLIELGRQVGLDAGFGTCVQDGRYRGWAGHVTEAAVRRGVSGTPTVMVNGEVVPNDPAKIAAAVTAAPRRP
jgi:protein-disulfide isomerase